MTENSTPIVLTDAATDLIKADVAAYKRDSKRYSDYVVEMEVTAETVAAHVALFRDAFKATNAKADGDAIKAYATKVRNGLNYWTGKAAGSGATSTKYVTALGLKEDDRDAFVSKCLAEYDAARSVSTSPTLNVVAA